MRKLGTNFLFITALCIQLQAASVALPFKNSFNSQLSPWTITNGGGNQKWQASYNYGNYYASLYAYNQVVDETLESPEIVASVSGPVILEFDYNAYLYAPAKFEVDVWNGSSWTKVDSLKTTNYTIHKRIDISAYKSATMKVRFHAFNSSDYFTASLYNIQIYEQKNVDLIADKVVESWNYLQNHKVSPVMMVINKGLQNQSDYKIGLDFNGVIKSINITNHLILPDDTAYFSLDTLVQFNSNSKLKFIVNVVGDGNTTNDTININMTYNESYGDSYMYAYQSRQNASMNLASYTIQSNNYNNGYSFGNFLPKFALQALSYINDTLYGIQNNTGIVGMFVGSGFIPTGQVNLDEICGMAWNRKSDKTYICQYDTATKKSYLYLLNSSTYKYSVIGKMADFKIASITCTPDGVMYALGMNNKLYTVDLTSGALSVVGSLGVTLQGTQSIAYCNSDKVLYAYIKSDSNGWRYVKIDRLNAAITTIGSYQSNSILLAIPTKYEIKYVKFKLIDELDQPISSYIYFNNSNRSEYISQTATLPFLSGTQDYLIDNSYYVNVSGSFTVPKNDTVIIKLKTGIKQFFKIYNELGERVSAYITINNTKQYIASYYDDYIRLEAKTYDYLVTPNYSNLSFAKGKITVSKEDTVQIYLTKGYQLSIKVLDFNSGKIISNAKVTIDGYEMATGTNGIADFYLPYKTYDVLVQSDKYSNKTTPITFNDFSNRFSIVIGESSQQHDYVYGVKAAENELISIYPNPASEWINIDATSDGVASVFNTSGILVQQIIVRQGQNQANISGLVEGMYVVKVVMNNEVFQSPLVIQH